MKMKIFIEGTVLEQPATGISKSLLELYKNSLEIEPDLDITVLHKKPLNTDLPNGIKQKQIGSFLGNSFLSNLIWITIILPVYVLIYKPDYVHFPWNGNIPYITNSQKILTINDVLPISIPGYFNSDDDKNNYLKNLQKSINRADIILTISEYSKMDIYRNFNVAKEIIVIKLGPTAKKYNGQHLTKSNYFLYVGGYDPRKGIEELLEIFIHLSESDILKQKLILTGSKNYFSTEFKELVEKGVELGYVKEMGYVSEEKLSELYSNAIALVYPSKYEGFGLPVLEAMNLGCPVITTECTSLPEVCGNAAYYVHNEEELVDSLINLVKKPKLRDELIIAGENQAKKFSWKLSAEIFLKNLQKNEKL